MIRHDMAYRYDPELGREAKSYAAFVHEDII